MSAELSARIIAAAAVLGDFRREDDAFMADNSGQAPVPNYGSWAGRLANALSDVLAQLDIEKPRARHAAAGSWVGPDGTATLTHEDLLLVIGALRVAVDVADPANMASRYELAALAYRLGGDT